MTSDGTAIGTSDRFTASRRRQLLADGALVGVTFVWGTSFVLVKDVIEQVTPMVWLTMRFTLGALALALIALFMGRLRGLTLQFHYQYWTFGTGHGWLFQIPDHPEDMSTNVQILSLAYRPPARVLPLGRIRSADPRLAIDLGQQRRLHHRTVRCDGTNLQLANPQAEDQQVGDGRRWAGDCWPGPLQSPH